jgi:hypothetical protein
MIAKKDYPLVQARLQSFLSEYFDDVSVTIDDDVYYRGTNLIVVTPAFRDLLPEQRFHHLVRAIPHEFYEEYLRGGIVWFELAPGEDPRSYMRMPRSDDVADQEPAILKQLVSVRFFQKLKSRLGPVPHTASHIDFVVSRQILSEAGLSPADINRACLFFIRHGGFCDAQVLVDVLGELAGSHVETPAAAPPAPPIEPPAQARRPGAILPQ